MPICFNQVSQNRNTQQESVEVIPSHHPPENFDICLTTRFLSFPLGKSQGISQVQKVKKDYVEELK